MSALWNIDWHAMFVPQVALLDIFLRGTFIYFLLLVLLRVFRREAGGIGVSDLLVIVLLADASQNAMSHDYGSITEGTVLVVTIIGWDFFLDWLAVHVPAVERLMRHAPVLLVKNGHILRANLRRELITREELMSQLRELGVGELADVRLAYMEGDGKISVSRVEADGPAHSKKSHNEGST